MNTRSGAISSSAAEVGPCSKPPSKATSRGLSPSRASSLVVPGSNWLSFDTSRPGIRSPANRSLICTTTPLGPVGDLLQALDRGELHARTPTTGTQACPCRKPSGLAQRTRQQPPRLLGQSQHLPPALPGPPTHGLGNHPQPPADRPRAIPHPEQRPRRPARSASRPRAPACGRHPASTRNRWDTAHPPSPQSNRSAPPAPGTCSRAEPSRSHTPRQLVDHLGAEATSQLAHRRLVRHPLPQGNQREPA